MPLGKLTVLPRPPSWTWWSLLGGEGNGNIRKGRGKKEKGGYGRGRKVIGPKKSQSFFL